MNAGDKTILIAKGIMLWAKVQAYSLGSYSYLEAEEEWLSFSNHLSLKEIQFIKDKQYALFDEINARL